MEPRRILCVYSYVPATPAGGHGVVQIEALPIDGKRTDSGEEVKRRQAVL